MDNKNDDFSAIQDFVDFYLTKFPAREDDPIDDFVRIAVLASDDTELPPVPPKKGLGYSAMIDHMSAYLEQVRPSEYDLWRRLLVAIFTTKYRGEKVYIKKRSAALIKYDAKNMTPKELMTKHGVSRAYAYRLRKNALKRKK